MQLALKLLKTNLTLNSSYLRYAIRLAISCFLIVALYQSLQLKNGYWAAFSVIACVWPTLGQSIQRSKHRIVGTFIGMLLGILIAHSFGSNRILIDILLPVFIFLTFYLKPFSYGLFATFTTVVTVLFICLIVPGDWQVAIIRLEMTTLGIVIALIATVFILPSRVSNTLPGKLTAVKQSLQQYYLLICQHYLNPRGINLRNMQSQTFKDLQTTLAIVEESRQEYWRLSNQYQAHCALYQTLDATYQCLMILEIHLPSQIKAAQLQEIAQQLNDILTQISLMFSHFDDESAIRLGEKLHILLENIQQQRTIACKDLSIPTASFYEHMQLTIFIETLLTLLDTIAKTESIPST